MSGLDPLDRELLDFLCACAHHRVRVIRVKAPRVASLRRLRYAGLVGLDDHLPSGSALLGWIERQRTRSEAAKARAAVDEPPAPRVAAEGGGAARCAAPPPIDLDRLLTCFSDRFETLRAVAMRFDARTPQTIVRHARMLHERGLIEQSPPTNGQPFCLWRRTNSQPQNIPENIPTEELSAAENREAYDAIANLAFAFGDKAPTERPKGKAPPTMADRARRFEEQRSKRNTKGASGTAKEAPSASPSGDAKRIEDRASTEEPALSVCPPARARPSAPKVDIKVNTRRDPTQRPDTPMMDLRDRQRANGMRRVALVNRGIEQKAAERLDAGEKGRNSVESAKMAEIERRRAEEFRLTNPIEQAKTVIRIGGWSCFSAVISGGPPDHYYIGNRMVDEPGLLAFAERLRTTRRRRA